MNLEELAKISKINQLSDNYSSALFFTIRRIIRTNIDSLTTHWLLSHSDDTETLQNVYDLTLQHFNDEGASPRSQEIGCKIRDTIIPSSKVNSVFNKWAFKSLLKKKK